MKKIAVFLAVLLLLTAPVLAAEPTEALSDVIGTDELTQSLPDEAAEVLDGLSPDGMPDFRSGVRSILRAAAGGSGGALRSGLRLCAVLLAMVTLCAVVRMSAQKDPVNAVSAVGALGICAATSSAIWRITPRSWVMKMIEVPCSSFRSFMSFRICA